ncbi:MAG: bifunctional UDP-sugar hydrolase/5'-nucleotidase [Bacilli bacterium]
MKKATGLFFALVLILGGCSKPIDSSITSSSSSSDTKAYLDHDLAVLYTNDTHCALGSDTELGFAKLSQYKKDLLADSNYVTLVDCGDAIQGDAIGTLSKGSYINDIMEEVGYEVAIPGNHEFDYGMDNFISLEKNSSIEYVSSNLTDLRTNSLVLKPYTIKEYDDVKIAYLGITTPKTITSSTPKYFQDDKGDFIYGFDQGDGSELFSSVQKYVDQAKTEGADYVVALSHLGITDDCSPYKSTQLIANTTGIDVVLDGHSHSVIECDRVKNKEGKRVLLSSTGTKFESFGMLYIDTEGNLSTGLIKECSGYDSKVDSYIKTIEDNLDVKLNEKVGETANLLTINNPDTGKRQIRNGETNMGDLCADAFKAVGESDISILNSGGIRTDIEKGDITYGDIIKVMPFNNMLAKAEAKGQQILDALEMSCMKAPSEFGGFLQVAGISYEYDTSIPTPVVLDKNSVLSSITGTRRVKNVLINDENIDVNKTYTVSSTTYVLKNSGDGNTIFKDCKFLLDESQLDNQTLMSYIKNNLNGVVGDTYKNPLGQGRIKDVTSI